MSGKTCLVTGVGSPVGREVALRLAKMGAVVVLASYDFGQVEAARSAIVGAQPSAQLDPHTLDLGKRLSISDFVGAFKERHTRLDVVVNVVNRSSRTKVEADLGTELTWMANVLGPYMLIERLIEVLRASTPARVIQVVSPYAGGLDLSDTDYDTRSYSGIKAYRQSMQAARLLAYGMSSNYALHGIQACACVPGVVRGDPGANFFSLLMAKPASAAAEGPVWLASAPEAANMTGKLFLGKKEIKDKLRDAGDVQTLWHTLGVQANQAVL
ncbi:MAG: SDR family NAD(P)-dependent oxidoreductase [Nannocystaceae bacterium]